MEKLIREIMNIMYLCRGMKFAARLDQHEAIESNITPAIRMTLQNRSQQMKIYEERMKKIFNTIKVMVINSYKEQYALLLTIPGAEDMSVIGIICFVATISPVFLPSGSSAAEAALLRAIIYWQV